MTATLMVMRTRNEVAMEITYDPVALIEEIRKRPGCWNTAHGDYKDKETRAAMWAEVAKAICSDSTLSKNALNQIVGGVQKRWKHMRDYFLAITASRKKIIRQRPYIYYENLTFLLKDSESTLEVEPYKERIRYTLGGDETEPEYEEEQNPSHIIKRAKIKKSISHGGDDHFDEEFQGMDETDILVSEPELNIKQENIREERDPFTEFQNCGQRFADEDSDKLFLESLLPHLRSIPEAHRLSVKVEVMQLLDKANKKYSSC